jgi:transcriptional regulator with XRE-family HTH domain
MNAESVGTNIENDIFAELKLPRRSEFYHLKPIGVGTPYVESLSGYASRLAQEHFITVSALLKHIIPLAPAMRHRLASYSKTILGSRIAALNFIKVLEALTMRRDLTWTTMVTWANVLPDLSLIRPRRAWCPVCYETWKKKNEVVYDLLLWAIEAVTVCPIHISPLIFSCPTCKSEIPHIALRSRPGFCWRCNSWLGHSQESSLSPSVFKTSEDGVQQLWKAHAVGKLLASAPNITIPARDNVAMSVKYYLDKYYWGRRYRFTSQLKISRNRLSSWLTGTSIPTLDAMLELTYELGVFPLNFLCGKSKSEEDFSAMNIESKCWRTRTSPVKTPLLHDEVKKMLTVAASNDKRESLSALVRMTGWGQTRIRNHFPSLCATIVARHREVYCRRIDRAKVLHTLRLALAETPPPPLREVADRIGCSTILLRHHFPEIISKLVTNYQESQYDSSWKCAEQLLKKCLSQEPPISLGKISCSIGIQKGELKKKFPALVAAIKLRFEECSRIQKEERHGQLLQKVHETVDSLEAEGIYPSNKRVAARLKVPNCTRRISSVLRNLRKSRGK